MTRGLRLPGRLPEVIPFGLKNAGSTYQRMVNHIFKEHIGRNMKIYVDDMLVKSRRRDERLGNFTETVSQLKVFRLSINPEKCSFGVTSRKFLSFMIRRLAALSRFISKSGDRNLSFFKKIRQASKEPFIWDAECAEAFAELKEYLRSPKLLTRPEGTEELQLYLAVSEGAVSNVLV
ncbi:hypothetical protein LIER_09435 [Lithospermum erythrorhizon]|uniref:Reverse transcriptase domain-containing protein n=1 Tax=Lithospermum erythrorhizon TaxID=34254 RepID=A0AAV3PHA5_LITER